MYDAHPELIAALKTILPTSHELVLHSGLSVPRISYQEINNSVNVDGDTLGYSNIAFRVKVWGHDLEELMHYAKEIDRVLKPLGWKRTNTNELSDPNSTMIQKILTYEALASEQF